MPANVMGDFASSSGVAHVDCIPEVKVFRKGSEIVRVRVHVVAVPRLSGTSMSAPVVRDDSITALAEKQHLSIPVVRSKGPPVTEYYGLALSPVLVENLHAVFSRSCWH